MIIRVEIGVFYARSPDAGYGSLFRAQNRAVGNFACPGKVAKPRELEP
jgi:hypothetical protein